MAVRIDGSTDILKRTATLPSLTNFTACGWLYTTAIQNYWGCVFGLESATTNAANQCLLTWNDSNPGKLGISVGGSNPIFTTSPSVGDWAFWAISCAGTGTNQVTGYLLLPGATTFQTVQGTRSAFTPAQMSIGNDSFGDEFHNGRIDGLRVWDAVLTSDELYQEVWSKRAVRRASLHLETPMADRTLADNYIDISGNGKDLTAAGTLSVEDGSPAPWRTVRPRMAYVPSAGGGTIAGGDGASLSHSTAFGAGSAIASGTGQSAGRATVCAQGIAIAAGNGVSLAFSTARAPQSVIASGSGASMSLSLATAPPGAIAAGAGFSLAQSIAFTSPLSIALGTGASLGLSYATGTASSATVALGVGVSLGLSRAFAAGSAIASGNGQAVASSIARAAGLAIAAGVGQSISQSSVRGVGSVTAAGVGRSLSLSLVWSSGELAPIEIIGRRRMPRRFLAKPPLEPARHMGRPFDEDAS